MSLFKRWRAFLSHHLVRKTMTLQIGGVLGTLIQAGAGVVMARLLQPDLYARYALAFSVASISSIFIGGAIIDAITPTISRAWARGDGEDLGRTVGFFIRFVAAGAGATLVLIALLPIVTRHLYESALIGGYAGVIVLASIVSTSLFSLTQISAQVAGRIRTLAALTLTDIIVRYGAMVTLVALGFGIWGAVSGHLVGAIVMFVIAASLYVRLERTHSIIPRLSHFLRLARGASWRPLLAPTLWVLADSNIAMLYGALPVALVGLHTTGAPLAYFKLAFGYLILAMSVMGPVSTVMNVHFPTVQTTAPGQLRQQFVRVSAAAVVLSALVTAVVLAIAPWVFQILYGTVYLPAVHYVYQFWLFGALFGLGVGLGPMWRSLGKVHVSIVINLLMLGVGIPVGLWFIGRWGVSGAVAMVTLWYTLSHIISFLYLLRQLPPANQFGTIESQ